MIGTNAKLTTDDVRHIRIRLAAGESQRSIAESYSDKIKNRQSISDIERGVSWRSVTKDVESTEFKDAVRQHQLVLHEQRRRKAKESHKVKAVEKEKDAKVEYANCEAVNEVTHDTPSTVIVPVKCASETRTEDKTEATDEIQIGDEKASATLIGTDEMQIRDGRIDEIQYRQKDTAKMEVVIAAMSNEEKNALWCRMLKKTRSERSVKCDSNEELCLIWIGSKSSGKKRKYGSVIVRKVHLRASRVAYILRYGAIPPGHKACHGKCDNTLCIEPTHLSPAKHKDRDGTNLKAERHQNATLTREQAQAIKDSRYSIESQVERAARFNCPVNVVRSIDNGYSWASLPFLGQVDVLAARKREERKQKDRLRRIEIKQFISIKEYKNIWSRMIAKCKVQMMRPDLVSTPCWLFTGAKCDGYGYTTLESIQLFAHIISYEIHHNACKRRNGLEVLHACDERNCFNPAHLSLGTHKTNAAHMKERGTLHCSAKLSPDDVHAIRTRLAAGETQCSIADSFRDKIKSRQTVCSISRGKSWSSIPVEDSKGFNDDVQRAIVGLKGKRISNTEEDGKTFKEKIRLYGDKVEADKKRREQKQCEEDAERERVYEANKKVPRVAECHLTSEDHNQIINAMSEGVEEDEIARFFNVPVGTIKDIYNSSL